MSMHRPHWKRCALIIGLVVCSGSAASAAVCWLVAWDVSVPAGKPAGLIGRGPYFDEPTALRWFRSLMPDWAAAQYAYDATRLESLSSAPKTEDGASSSNPSETGRPSQRVSAGYFVAGGVLVRFEIGEGLYDRVVLTQIGVGALDEDSSNPREIESWRDFLGDELLRECSTPTEFELQLPTLDALGSFGVGDEPHDWGKQALWQLQPLPAISHQPSSAPRAPELLEPDSQITRLNDDGTTRRKVSEIRLYGWPLRCMTVHGVRVQRWESAEDLGDGMVTVLQDDHWTDAVLDFEHHSNWSFDADQPPATGLPWKPLWLPFLANSLILGVPLTLAGFGVLRTVRWGTARIRGRGDKCPRCGYARTGLARDAACPECGGT
jgi:hypothetical protein